MFHVKQGILVETLPMPYRDEIKGLSEASGLNLGKMVDFVIQSITYVGYLHPQGIDIDVAWICLLRGCLEQVVG